MPTFLEFSSPSMVIMTTQEAEKKRLGLLSNPVALENRDKAAQ